LLYSIGFVIVIGSFENDTLAALAQGPTFVVVWNEPRTVLL
jgi:hypothetical protein